MLKIKLSKLKTWGYGVPGTNKLVPFAFLLINLLSLPLFDSFFPFHINSSTSENFLKITPMKSTSIT